MNDTKEAILLRIPPELKEELPHEDEVIVMAKEYNAPELIEYYCKHVCAISAYCHKDK